MAGNWLPLNRLDDPGIVVVMVNVFSSRFRTRAGVLGIVCGLVVGILASGAVQARPLVERISFTAHSDGHGYVIRVHTDDLVQAYWEPHRPASHVIEWRLFDADLAPSLHQDAPEGPVRTYSARRDGRELVLRFELDEGASVDAAAYRDRGSTDLLLNLTYRERNSASDAPPVVTVSDTEDQAPAHAGERWKLDTIVIDAGHGGRDVGARANGLREKDVTLAVAKKLGYYLEDRLGVRVVYTREDDRFIPLRERGHIANEAGGKLFVSIHVNAAPNRSAHGTETFFLGMHKTEAARRVMERENSVVQLESDPNHYETFDEQSLILQTMAQSAYMRKSEQLAERVEQQFAERVQRTSRGVKQAGFYVLWSASMPAVLVELGFLTNPYEASFLKSDLGQDYLASAIFRAVRAYKAQYEKGLAVRH